MTDTAPKISAAGWTKVVLLLLAMFGLMIFFESRLVHTGHRRPPITPDVVRNTQRAVDRYRVEYTQLPDVGRFDFEMDGPEGIRLATILLGKEASSKPISNFRQIPFLNLRINSNPKRGGLVFSSDQKVKGVYDAWGQPIRVVFRQAGQSFIEVFHRGRYQRLDHHAVAMSRGPDGLWGNEDDIVSW